MAKIKHLLLTLVVMLFWGSLFPVVKLGFAAFAVHTTGDLLLFAGIRFFLCGGVIMGYAYLRDATSYRNTKCNWDKILLVGLFSVILHYAFTYVGLSMADSSKTALLKKVGVLIYIGCSSFFLREDRVTLPKICGALLGFVGIVAMNSGDGGFSMHLGDWLIIAASFCTVFSNTIGKKLFACVHPIVATGLSQLFGGAVLMMVGAIMGGSVHFSLTADLWIFVYICVASVFSYALWFWLLRDGELSKMLIVQFAEPMFAAVFGFILLGEDILNWKTLLAFTLIFAGVVVSQISFGKQITVKRICNKRCTIGEGPIWNVAEQKLYFVNGLQNEICKLDIKTGALEVIDDIAAAAIAFDVQNQMIVSCDAGVFHLSKEGLLSPLYDTDKYHILHGNDMKVGPDGNLYVGTQSEKRLGLSGKINGKLYRIDQNGNVQILLDGLSLSNGMDWSADECRFYHTDSDTHTIKEYDFDKDTGIITTTGREVKVQGVDGFCMDESDCIYAACWGQGHIAVVDTKTMTVIRYLETPTVIPTSCCFCEDDASSLAVTTASYTANSTDTEAGCTFVCKLPQKGRNPYLYGGENYESHDYRYQTLCRP